EGLERDGNPGPSGAGADGAVGSAAFAWIEHPGVLLVSGLGPWSYQRIRLRGARRRASHFLEPLGADLVVPLQRGCRAAGQAVAFFGVLAVVVDDGRDGVEVAAERVVVKAQPTRIGDKADGVLTLRGDYQDHRDLLPGDVATWAAPDSEKALLGQGESH